MGGVGVCAVMALLKDTEFLFSPHSPSFSVIQVVLYPAALSVNPPS